MNDPRIGKMGVSEPTVCAISEQPLKRPWVTHSLDNGYFCRVNANRDRFWSSAVESQLKAMLAGGKSQPVTVEKDEKR